MARRRNQIPSTSETNLYFAKIMLIAFCVQPSAIFLHSVGKFPSCLCKLQSFNVYYSRFQVAFQIAFRILIRTYVMLFLDFLKVFFCIDALERTFSTCSAPNLPVDFLTGVCRGVCHYSSQ